MCDKQILNNKCEKIKQYTFLFILLKSKMFYIKILHTWKYMTVHVLMFYIRVPD